MPCNCNMEDSSASSQHQNGCEMNARRSSTGQNGHHHPHRKLFQDNGHEDEVKESKPEEPVDRDTVRL